ncbi:hypothetical protein [Ferroglobus placidus]|nr:hypothetical protein [Ferroglobus placidus]
MKNLVFDTKALVAFFNDEDEQKLLRYSNLRIVPIGEEIALKAGEFKKG